MSVSPVQPRSGHTALPNELLAQAFAILTPDQFRLLVGLFYEAEFKREGSVSSDGWRVGFGQVLVSYEGLSRRFGLSVASVRRALSRFEAFGLSSSRSVPGTPTGTPPGIAPVTPPGTPPTTISLGKWGAYLGSQSTPGTPPGTSTGTPPDTQTGTVQHRNTGTQNTGDPRDAQASLFASPVAVTFPCDGNPDHYDVTEAWVAEQAKAFPSLDVLGQVRRALAWVNASPERRKTARGMPKFLVGWLGRAQDNGGGRSAKARVAAEDVPPEAHAIGVTRGF